MDVDQCQNQLQASSVSFSGREEGSGTLGMGVQVWVLMPTASTLPGALNTGTQPTLRNCAQQGGEGEKRREVERF